VQAALGRRSDALANYESAARLAPSDLRILNNLGALLVDMNRADEALAWYRKALALAPNDVGVLDNLGTALRKTERLAEAVAAHEAASRLAPNSARSHNHLGVALMEMNRTDEAIAAYCRSLALDPRSHRTHNNLALALKHTGRREESLAGFRRAASLAPNDIVSLNNLGVALMECRHFGEALALFEQAIRLDPDDADSHLHRAILWLVTGDFVRGWPEYERRPARTALPIPAWDGSPLDGRTILLRSEQGFGDAIHFVRYAVLVKARGGVVVLETRPELASLLATCPGVDRVLLVGAGTDGIDVQTHLGSLPGIFGSNLSNIPAPIPYLHPGAERVGIWRQRLGPRTGLRVGIAWQGSRVHTGDRQRSVDPDRFAEFAAIPGVELFRLQKGTTKQPTFAHIDRTAELDTFLDTAALMKNLDLVVTVDTAVAHLAGALGQRTWILLPTPGDFRWLLHRDDSPWYPTARLFRQPTPGDWATPLRRLRDELSQLARPQ
jgi:Flp pilus assembly protein TadD